MIARIYRDVDNLSRYTSAMISHRRMSRVVILCALVLHLAGPAQAASQIVVSQTLGASVHPLGVSLGTRVLYRIPLYAGLVGDQPPLLLENTRLEAGVSNQLTPAFNDVALDLYIEPLAILDIRVRYGWRQAYDALGFGFMSVPAGGSVAPPDFSGDTTSRRGTFLELTPRVKAALGPVVILNSVTLRRITMEAEDGESGWFYEPLSDEPLRRGGWITQNATTLLYRLPVTSPDQLLIGMDNTLLWADGDDLRRWRTVAMLVWATDRVVPSAELSLIAQVGGYPEHRAYQLSRGELYVALQAGITRSW